MKLEEFQALAPKTLNDLTIPLTPSDVGISEELHNRIIEAGRRANLGHMAMGMAGELLSEALIADSKADFPNLLEEVTDCKWYIVVIALWKGFTLSSERLANHVIGNPDIDNVRGMTSFVANICVGTLVDVVKRESCYGTAKYQKKEVTPEVYENLIYDALSALDNYLASYALDPMEGYDRVIEKLHKVRYKDGYSDAAALNRDLDLEKGAIDGNYRG